MNQNEEKQPKETDAIKKRLEDYAAYQRKIDNQIERLETLSATMGSPSTPNLSGLPSGGGDGTSKTERQILKKMELEDKIRDMVREERRQRAELEALIDMIRNTDEQTVIEMRYFDREKWWAISAALFGNEPDYDEYERRYLKRTFKLHGSALQALTRAYNEKNRTNTQQE